MTRSAPIWKRSCQLAAIGLAACVLVGCAEDGPPRVHVSGNATWKGKPIPSGYITFLPDTKKGNSGPQGVAWIKDGAFDSRDENGRGVSPGDQIVTIYGFDGVNVDETHPWGKPLFIEHRESMAIGDAADELTLVVPDTARQYSDIR